MPRETHVLRFKVVSVECPSLPDGQQYTIMYHRGGTNRSTPCYTAQKGVINFAAMPEGAAVVHFKSGHAGTRFAPKYIRFMVEEYTRGMPRRLVGETEVDCTQVMKGYGTSGSGILAVGFRLYGTTAKMKIAVLVYLESAPPLSFDGLIDPSAVAAPPPPQTVKVMNRGEAMMILMGLETMLERRRTMEAEGQKAPQTREEKKLAELEERRKALVGAEGLATEVIRTRCEEVVAVQYTALARKHRNNFIGQTAAYLREMAINSGEDFTGDDDATSDNTALEQLNRVNRSLDDLQEQLKKLEEEQLALGRIQHKVDVTAELCANLDKASALQKKAELLQQSRTALTEAVRKQAAKKDSPLSREVAAINARIAALTAEQQQMRPKIQHMVSVAASHVVKWGRSKNPPEADISSRADATRATGTGGNGLGRNTVDDLFSDAGKPQKSKEQTMLDDVQRKQVVEALKGLKASAPPPTAHSPTSASSSSGHRTPRDLFADSGLPTMGDFSSAQKKKDEEAEAQKKAAAAKPVHEDPLKPSGLGMDMFSAKPPPAAASAAPPGLPSMNDFMRPSASARQPEPQAMFDFGAILQANQSPSPPPGGGFGGGGGFVLEPQRPEPTFGGGAASPGAPAVTVAYNKKDDPYYDEMDDFTVTGAGEDGGNTFGAVEITSGFAGFGEESSSPARPSNASPPAGHVAPRPTFDFGPSGGFGGFEGSSGAPTASPAATFSFGGGAAEEPSATNRNSDNPYSGISNLPTYNFGS